MSPSRSRIAETEHWFIKRGIPQFTADYSASEDVLTRALPVLILAFLASAVAAIDVDWPAAGIVASIAGGFVLLLGAWAGLNRVRGRPPLAPPQRVGPVEVAAFLVIPSALPVVFGGDWRGAAVTLAVQTAVLAVVYAATSYGLVAIGAWGVAQGVRSLRQTVSLFARGLPLLLLGFMFLFINAEAWQSAGTLEGPLLLAVFGLFALMGVAFVVSQVPRELRDATSFGSWEEIADLCAGTPMDGAVSATGTPEVPPLTRREWSNLGLVVLVGQGLRILVVAVLVGAFFVLLGLLAIRPDTIEQWTGAPPTLWWHSFTWFGVAVRLTRELIQVAAFLASFAALYFSVYTITDATFRAEFFEDIVAEARQNLAVRGAYRGALDGSDAA